MSIGAAPAILDGNILKYMDYQALEALDASIKQLGVFPPVLFGRASRVEAAGSINTVSNLCNFI
jgi:hypothetical protein